MKKDLKPQNEEQALAELEKWARLCLTDMKFYIGLRDALEDLDEVRAKRLK